MVGEDPTPRSLSRGHIFRDALPSRLGRAEVCVGGRDVGLAESGFRPTGQSIPRY